MSIQKTLLWPALVAASFGLGNACQDNDSIPPAQQGQEDVGMVEEDVGAVEDTGGTTDVVDGSDVADALDVEEVPDVEETPDVLVDDVDDTQDVATHEVTLASLSITPEPAFNDSVLACEASVLAIGGEPSVEFSWSLGVDEVGTGNTLALAGLELMPGDEVTCMVRAQVGQAHDQEHRSIWLANRAPIIDEVTILPEEPRTADALTATVSAHDPDGQPLQVGYTWTVTPPDGGQSFDVHGEELDALHTARGAQIELLVEADDGIEVTTLRVDSITIQNTAPTPPQIAIVPDDAGADEALRCEVVEESADADGDPVAYEFSWLVDGVAFEDAVDSALASEVDGEFVQAHQLWQCTVVADDGNTGWSEPAVASITTLGQDYGWRHVAAASTHVCAVRQDESLWCWGRNLTDDLGSGTSGDQYSPVPVLGGGAWQRAIPGSGSSCALAADETISCWGNNGWGQLGNGTFEHSPAPVATTGGMQWSQATTGGGFACAIQTNGALWCWGKNNLGYFGDGYYWGWGNTHSQCNSDNYCPNPISVGGSSSWLRVTANNAYMCALRSDGALYCSGENFAGRLGNGTLDNAVEGRVLVSGGGVWKEVSAGSTHVCAIRSDDSLWCWGHNNLGQLGLGHTTDAHTPALVDDNAVWQSVSAGGNHGCALRADNSLWCWGNNQRGMLGDGTTTHSDVPIPIMADHSWLQVSAADGLTCAIRADDHSLWCWGVNPYGQLGRGTRSSFQAANHPEPVPPPEEL